MKDKKDLPSKGRITDNKKLLCSFKISKVIDTRKRFVVAIKILKRHNGRKIVISTYTLASAERVVVHNGLSNNVSKTVNYRRVEPPPLPQENFLEAMKKANKKAKKSKKKMVWKRYVLGRSENWCV